MITTTISAQNQITLPAFLLKLLKIKSGDKLIVDVEKKELRIRPVGKSLIESIAGSITVEGTKKGLPFEKVLEETKKEIAQHLAAK